MTKKHSLGATYIILKQASKIYQMNNSQSVFIPLHFIYKESLEQLAQMITLIL